MRTINFFIFVVVVVALPLFWQLRARDSLQKSAGFWLEGSAFFPDFRFSCDFLLLPTRFHISTLLLQPRAHIAEAAAAATTPPAAAAEARE